MDTLLTRESLKAEMAGTYKMSGEVSYLAALAIVPRLSLISIPAQTGPIGWAPADSSQATSTVQSTSIQLKVQKTVHETYDHSLCEDVEGKIVPLAV